MDPWSGAGAGSQRGKLMRSSLQVTIAPPQRFAAALTRFTRKAAAPAMKKPKSDGLIGAPALLAQAACRL